MGGSLSCCRVTVGSFSFAIWNELLMMLVKVDFLADLIQMPMRMCTRGCGKSVSSRTAQIVCAWFNPLCACHEAFCPLA